MTERNMQKLVDAINKDGRRMDRDKKYAHQVYVRLRIMTPKGNLTRHWQQYSKKYGPEVIPGRYWAIRRALGLS